MIEKYFTDGYRIERYEEAKGAWSDGEGHYIPLDTVEGYIRALGSTERTDVVELKVTHRFYTKFNDIEYGDKIIKDSKEYKVKLAERKHIKTSRLDFMQVDCELII